MPARNAIIETTVETTSIAATPSQARGVARQAEAGAEERKHDAQQRRDLDQVQRENPRLYSPAEAAAEHHEARVDERRRERPGNATRRRPGRELEPPAVSAQPAKAPSAARSDHQVSASTPASAAKSATITG